MSSSFDANLIQRYVVLLELYCNLSVPRRPECEALQNADLRPEGS